ncbi:hypothetical protein J3E71DRAFT_368429 [Bipolaris maydis]|nr:hypothetical protein J3E71DRAFT_368429 [Bipolaris maydis]
MAMALENYVRDLSYLTSGNLSDLTLNFGEKSWQIHKALACCHSKWFRKAVTIGFEETDSGVVTLQDDIEFTDAVDCMVSYFYEAGYNASKYSTSESIIHAQVAIIADKYDCVSLYNLTRTSFANTVKAVESDDWAVIAAFTYDNTSTEVPAHVELRGLVVATIAGRHSALKSTLRIESIVELLRSSADLATDLLLGRLGLKAKDGSEHIFMCDYCHYVHTGPHNCSNVVSRDSIWGDCPQCGNSSGTTSKRYTQNVRIVSAFSCPVCDGIHTAAPMEPESAPAALA